MDKESCISLFNSYLNTPTVNLGKKILEIFTEEKEIPNKEKSIEQLINTPGINSVCVDRAIEEICRNLNINTVSKNNQTILFY